jgi:hypothetical protein
VGVFRCGAVWPARWTGGPTVKKNKIRIVIKYKHKYTIDKEITMVENKGDIILRGNGNFLNKKTVCPPPETYGGRVLYDMPVAYKTALLVIIKET